MRDSHHSAGACSGTAGEAERAHRLFREYTQHRRLRLDAQIGDRGAEGVRLLPLLLHVNQPGLPGYVPDSACPVGIADYSPTHTELGQARRLFAGSSPKRSGILRPAVDTVAIMGSAGSIGFSGDSDLDVWICHRGFSSDREEQLYLRKTREVEAWLAGQTGFEIHLFLQSTGQVWSNDFGETDVEGCGSAMGALLKEEFYRTGIVLAGKKPFWWLVRPGAAPEAYQAAVQELVRHPAFSGGYVDLGWVATVPVGELFGAAIWQIVKGWKSPFKSSLKMGLLEKAVRSAGKEGPPLCEMLKEQVLAGERPDPYRLMFEHVLAYYRAMGDAGAEDLLARSFYLKTGIRLDPAVLAGSSRPSGDEAVLARYVSQWGWGPRRIRHLNEFGRWNFEWVEALAKEVNRYFLRTYKRIRSALDESGEVQRITPRDLTLLGRKLQTVYRRVPHKVETLNLVAGGVEESTISLYQETLPDGESPWRLYRGRVTPINVDESESGLLRLGLEPLELLVWAAQNRILGAHTRVLWQGMEREVPAAELESLTQQLAIFTREANQTAPALERLLQDPRPVKLFVIPNLGVETDAVRDVAVLYSTTWGELFYRKWSGAEAFGSFVEQALVPFLLESPEPAAVSVFVPSRKAGSFRGLQRRLQRELPAVAEFLGGRDPEPGVRRRYVGGSQTGYFVLDRTDREGIRYRVFPQAEALLRYLSGVGPHRRVDTRVESQIGSLAVLRAVLESSAPGGIDVFVLTEAEVETLFVVDEVGNFIHFPRRSEGEPYGLAKLLLFLEGVLPEIAAQDESPLAGRGLAGAVRIHTLMHEGACRALNRTHEHLAKVRSLGLRPVGLTIEKTGAASDGAGYRITWGTQVIQSGGTANPLEELRRRIRESRQSGLDYDVFVTRLFLDERFTAEYCGPFVTTGHYLFYKKAIEQRLSS